MANLITAVVTLLFDIACGCSFGWSWIWIAATTICVIDLVFNVYVYATTKTKPRNTSSKSKLEEIRNIITTNCMTELGWDAVGSGIIGDNAIDVWCITPDGKKGKSCIYKADADGVNCYVNVNNINWGDINDGQ